jgi:hypothetical protein
MADEVRFLKTDELWSLYLEKAEEAYQIYKDLADRGEWNPDNPHQEWKAARATQEAAWATWKEERDIWLAEGFKKEGLPNLT